MSPKVKALTYSLNLFIICCIILSCENRDSQSTAINELTVNYQINPIGINKDNLRFASFENLGY